MSTRAWIRLLSLATVWMALTGCKLGPYWDTEEIALPAITPLDPINSVVVSDMYYSPYETSVTYSHDVIRLREAVAVDDVSSEIAGVLRERGVPSVARVNARPDGLQAGQVLVRGTFTSKRHGRQGFAVLTSLLTLGVLGFVLPNPVPFDHGVLVGYRVEVVDAQGNILADANGEVWGYYRTHSAWNTNWEDAERELPPLVRSRVAESLAKRIQEAKTSGE